MSLVNAFLVRWSDGYFELLDDASIAAYGRREAYLELGAVASEAEAMDKAKAELTRLAHGEHEFGAGIEPISFDDMPFISYRTADTVLVPDKANAPVRKQVAAVNVVENDNGELEFDLELGDIIRTPEERHQITLDKMAHGTLRGNSVVATPATPGPAVQASGALDKMIAATPTTGEVHAFIATGPASGMDADWHTAVLDTLVSSYGTVDLVGGLIQCPIGLWQVNLVLKVSANPIPADSEIGAQVVTNVGSPLYMEVAMSDDLTSWLNLSGFVRCNGDLEVQVHPYIPSGTVTVTVEQFSGHFVAPTGTDL